MVQCPRCCFKSFLKPSASQLFKFMALPILEQFVCLFVCLFLPFSDMVLTSVSRKNHRHADQVDGAHRHPVLGLSLYTGPRSQHCLIWVISFGDRDLCSPGCTGTHCGVKPVLQFLTVCLLVFPLCISLGSPENTFRGE